MIEKIHQFYHYGTTALLLVQPVLAIFSSNCTLSWLNNDEKFLSKAAKLLVVYPFLGGGCLTEGVGAPPK
jgi:hypothetical protein